MLIISLIGFFIQDSLGDPVRQLVGDSVSTAEQEILREKLGLNDSFVVQYTRFIKNAVQGDLGNSYFFKEPVVSVILQHLPATLELTLAASFLVIFISFPLGILAAVFPFHPLMRLVMTLSAIGISIPVFLTAIFLIYIFPVNLGLFYSFGRGEVVDLDVGFIWQTSFLSIDGFLHIILPATALSSIMLPLFIRLVRSEMREVLEQEYIRFAYARGINKWRILFSHALKNAMLPILSVGGVQFATMISYTILTESVFQWPGMGFMFLEAVNRSDIPLIVSYIIFVGLIFVTTNTLVDMLYTFVNPNVKLKDQ